MGGLKQVQPNLDRWADWRPNNLSLFCFWVGPKQVQLDSIGLGRLAAGLGPTIWVGLQRVQPIVIDDIFPFACRMYSACK